MLVRRSHLPTRVTRGSLRILKMGVPDFSFRCSRSSIWPSASVVIVRNLIIRNLRLLMPKRSCTKKIAPGEFSLIAMATTTNKGAQISRLESRELLRKQIGKDVGGDALLFHDPDGFLDL